MCGSSMVAVVAVLPRFLIEFHSSWGELAEKKQKKMKNKQDWASEIRIHFSFHYKLRIQWKELYNWCVLKFWDRNCLHPWLTVLTVHGFWTTNYWHMCVAILSSSFSLPSFHFLAHNTSLCIYSLVSFPSHFASGWGETSYYTEFLVSQTSCIIQQASLKIIEIITVVYFIHTHIYMFLYIYSSLSLCNWEMHPGFISVMRKGR